MKLQFPKEVARFIDRYRSGFTTMPSCPETLEHVPLEGSMEAEPPKRESWPTYQAYLKDRAARQPDAAPYRYYRCPCGGTDHCASRSKDPDGQVGDGYADVLHCYETGKQWFVGGYRGGETNVQRCQRIIRDEELKYIAHIERSPKTVERFLRRNRIEGPEQITGEHLAVLWSTHGIEPDVVEAYFRMPGGFSESLHEDCLRAREREKDKTQGRRRT